MNKSDTAKLFVILFTLLFVIFSSRADDFWHVDLRAQDGAVSARVGIDLLALGKPKVVAAATAEEGLAGEALGLLQVARPSHLGRNWRRYAIGIAAALLAADAADGKVDGFGAFGSSGSSKEPEPRARNITLRDVAEAEFRGEGLPFDSINATRVGRLVYDVTPPVEPDTQTFVIGDFQ